MRPRSSTHKIILISLFLLPGLSACGSGKGGANDPVPQALAWASPTEGRAPLTVDFAGDARGGDAPVSLSWDFGDGETGDGEAVRHTFEVPGPKVITLLATDRDGDSDQAEVRLTITAGILGATLRAVPELGVAPLQVRFTGVIAGGTPPYATTWTYGDGGSDSIESPTHTFVTPGDYDVVFLVNDAAGKSTQSGVRITASATPVPLSISALASPASGAAPLGVQFSATVNGGSPPYTYSWTFGDGASSQDEAPMHGYATAGTFDAQLTVGDSGGNAATDTVAISVGAPVRVVINELRYDSSGVDRNCFIELSGEPLASLDGFSLVGLNGQDGSVYATLDLTGQTIPADGFFVLAQSTSSTPPSSQIDLRTEFANLQNGPDALHLVRGGVVVDAVAYTGQGPGTPPPGEGNTATGVPAEHSLARDAQSRDTADNAADFSDDASPTPGAING